jgi:hypothetical protein
VLRGIFEPKRCETKAAGENCIMRSFTSYNCNAQNENKMCRECRTHGNKSNAYRILVGKPEGKRPLGRPRRRWEDNIEINLRETSSGSMDWIHLAQDRDQWRALVNTVMNLRIP